jgi:hypothetical protein
VPQKIHERRRGRLRSTSFIFNTRPFKAGCLRFGAATLCRCSQHGVKWGRLGWNGVKTGGRGWGASAPSGHPVIG